MLVVLEVRVRRWNSIEKLAGASILQCLMLRSVQDAQSFV